MLCNFVYTLIFNVCSKKKLPSRYAMRPTLYFYFFLVKKCVPSKISVGHPMQLSIPTRIFSIWNNILLFINYRRIYNNLIYYNILVVKCMQPMSNYHNASLRKLRKQRGREIKKFYWLWCSFRDLSFKGVYSHGFTFISTYADASTTFLDSNKYNLYMYRRPMLTIYHC